MTEQDYAEAIRDAYRAASAEDIRCGRDWYPTAGRMIGELAAWSGIEPARMAAIVAALSPRNPWKWNVADAANYAAAIVANGPMPSATTFGANRRAAWSLGTGAADWKTAALKVRSFVANMTGDPDAVTVDVWAVRVATRGAVSAVRNDREYRTIADAYRTVAAEVGETPRDLQAIVWVAAERVGLGSNRRGQHGRTCKTGTPAIVRRMFGETE